MQQLVGSMVAGRYDVLALIGTGGMGAVYRAHDRELDEVVALKVIRSDRASQPAMVEQFRHEVKLARRVTHVNIARTFELGLSDEMLYCTMELVEGESLRSLMERMRSLPQSEAAAIARALCSGLEVAHAAGVIHRDIKPDNVLVTAQQRVVLVDFGVASITAAESPGQIAGTPHYMAPEQARGEAPTPATDLYAVGVVLYEMLSGQRAFSGPSIEILIAKQEIEHLVLAGVPDGLRELVARATAREPADRYASARALADALAPWSAAMPQTAAPVRDAGELATVVVLAPRGDKATLHLVEGVHHELLRRLSQQPRMRVWPRLERVEGDAPHVTLDADRGLVATIDHAGRSTVMRLPLDVSTLAASAAAVASALTDTIASTHEHRESFELLLRARSMQRSGFKHARETLALLRQAHALDPDDASIAAELAVVLLRYHFMGVDFDDAFEVAPQLVRQALAAAPHLAESHVAAAQLELQIGDPVIAANEYRAAIACSPFLADPHEGLGRMLLEAGFLADAVARIDEALAIAPNLSAVHWEIARAHALEGSWDVHDALVAELNRFDDRPIARFRFALWRGDTPAIWQIRELTPVAFESGLYDHVFDALLNDRWTENRSGVLDHAGRGDWPSKRRNTFLAQIAAETAGYFGDVPGCLAMLRAAVGFGLFDHHWFTRVPTLACVRGTADYMELHDIIKSRADAIHDALFRDRDGPDTVVLASSWPRP